MKILILKDVGGVGQHGTVKEVKDGYALNFLIPKGLAVQATPEKVAAHAKQAEENAKKADAANKDMVEKLHNLNGRRVVVRAPANKQGHLFKGINKKAVADELSNLGAAILPDTITGLEDAIKEVGEYVIHVVDAGVDAAITIAVEAAN